MKSNKESGFSVACNKVKCAKVTTLRNERNFFKKFLKWSYQVVTARKIQESEIPDGRSAQREAPVSESRNEQKAKALRMTGLSAKEFQESGFSVACNKVKCAKVTTKRNERNFFKKFLKWSYQVVTARKIQESEIPDGRSAQREAPVSESRNEQKAKALRMTGLSAKEFQDSGFCGTWQGASPNAVSEQSGDDCEPAIIQESRFSVVRNDA